LILIRKQNEVFADSNNLLLYDGHNPHVFIYERTSAKDEGVLVVCNFSESQQAIADISLGPYGSLAKPKDLITGKATKFVEGKLELKPYQLFWLSKT